MLNRSVRILGFVFLGFWISSIAAQDPGDARPVVGLRENPPDLVVLENARVIVQPGQALNDASVVIRGTSIIAVGNDLDIPSGAEVVDCTGKTIYAGLIDSYGEIEVSDPSDNGAGHWNGNIAPRRVAADAVKSISDSASYRNQGVTMRLIAPQGAIVKGASCLVLLDRDKGATLVNDDIAQHLQLTVPRDKRRDSYPNSPMGAVAILRQSLMDADWYRRVWKAYSAQPELPRPQRNDDLARLADDQTDGRFVVDAPNERMALRADSIASEFSLDAAIRGSGREYRDLERIVATNRVLFIPVDFPDAPDVASEVSANEVDLRELMHWHFAPENPGRLVDAGATICLTTDGLEDTKSFLKNVRSAVQRGLSADNALESLTTSPASWIDVSGVTGKVTAGSLANLLITDGDLFDQDTSIVETWVSGKRFEISSDTQIRPDPLPGKWDGRVNLDGKRADVQISLKREKKKWTGKVVAISADDHESEKDPPSSTLKKITRAVDRLTAWADLSKADAKFPKGPSLFTLVTFDEADQSNVFASLTLPDGSTQTLNLRRSSDPGSDSEPNAEADDDSQPKSDAESDSAKPNGEQPDEQGENQKETDEEKSGSERDSIDQIVVNYPLGGYGVVRPVSTAPAVLFRGATVWTCGESGVLKDADVLVINGIIDSIGEKLSPPKDCKIVDAKGKHITPGLIDCHSHMATDGGVNESGQAVTAEVRVGDFVDNSDINIYRQLAGGLTMANILHGSANPIGGQNQVIKLRWGDGMEAMKMQSAPSGIKFALGENVKRSNRTEPQTRYPASRMGVEQLFRDRFLAAKEYRSQHRRWREGVREGLPPRRDLELETIAEIVRGQRWIHCHSYRQDEIVALLDVLDEFGITIGTLQHILEGYKVADRMLQHGAMASAFSDWWAYKFEVYDAIPDNGAIMHDVGIVVSFNSDDRELARHLNTEAAKAMKYGGVPAEEALKFVTLNPAKQLRIDQRAGSVEPGKDADLVLWNGPPLSTLTRCEQTWVDGRLMFSIERDRESRTRDARWRSLLIASILDGDSESKKDDDPEVDEEDRWLRYDEFCHGHDHQQHDDQDGLDHSGHNHAGQEHTLREYTGSQQ